MFERAVEYRVERAILHVRVVVSKRAVPESPALAKPSVFYRLVSSCMLGVRKRNSAVLAKSIFHRPEPDPFTFWWKRTFCRATFWGVDFFYHPLSFGVAVLIFSWQFNVASGVAFIVT